MSSSVTTNVGTTRRFEATKVYYSLLLNGTWAEADYLEPLSLGRFTGPDIDEARFLKRYGRFAGRNVLPLDLDRYYLKLVVRNTEAETAEAAGGPVTDQIIHNNAHLIWYGVVEVDDLEVQGTQRRTHGTTTSITPQGDQVITAFGLLRELETTIIRESTVETYEGGTQVIGRGIPFNEFRGGRFAERGNRTTGPMGGYDGYVFSNQPVKKSIWTGSDALRYLIKFHQPKDESGNVTANWELHGGLEFLDWFDITVATDGRSVKDVIDDLIDRRRLVGYWVDAAELGGHGTGTLVVKLHVFAFTDEQIDMPDGKKIEANQNQVTLDFEESFDIDRATLSKNRCHTVDKVRVRGDFITSTFTTFLSSTMLQTGWSSGDETTYKNGASGVAGYDALSTEDKQELNQLARDQETLEEVYAKFTMRDSWNLIVPEKFDASAQNYQITTTIAALDGVTSTDIRTAFREGEHPKRPVWTKGKQFLRALPIRVKPTDDLSEFRDPFCIFKIDSAPEDSADHRWQFSDKLNSTASAAGALESNRQFSARLQMQDKALGVNVQVGAAGGQQLIAKGHWSGAALTADRYDPDKPDGNGVDYDKMTVTVSMEWDDRIEFVKGAGPVGNPVREMYIDIPDARLDFIIPGTVTGLDESGKLVRNVNGEIIRDDRKRLEQICNAAFAWYSKQRQALKLQWKSLAALFTDDDQRVEIGWLITSVGGQYSLEDVNSPITGWTYDFESGTTSIETAFALLDVTNQAREFRL